MAKKEIQVDFPGVFIVHQKIAGYRVEEHEHDGHEFFFPQQGEITLDVNGQLLQASAGKAIYMPPNTGHSFQASKHGVGERIILVISSKFWKEQKGDVFPARAFTVTQLARELIFYLLLNPETKARSSLVSTLIQVVSESLEFQGESYKGDLAFVQDRSRDDRIKKVIQLMKSDLSENIPMVRLAKESGLSTRNLNRLFLSEMGLSPKKLLTLLRVESAKKLLLQPSATVTDTAFEVGYQSVSQFISSFQKVTGILPSHYQQAHGILR